jgi:hypothetical protein
VTPFFSQIASKLLLPQREREQWRDFINVVPGTHCFEVSGIRYSDTVSDLVSQVWNFDCDFVDDVHLPFAKTWYEWESQEKEINRFALYLEGVESEDIGDTKLLAFREFNDYTWQWMSLTPQPNDTEEERSWCWEFMLLGLIFTYLVNSRHIVSRKRSGSYTAIKRLKRALPVGKYPYLGYKEIKIIPGTQIQLKKIDPTGNSWTQVRHWVMGHFHTYHTRNGPVKKWINEYQKGDESKGTRDTRYRVELQ